jgi:hypothetical protein
MHLADLMKVPTTQALFFSHDISLFYKKRAGRTSLNIGASILQPNSASFLFVGIFFRISHKFQCFNFEKRSLLSASKPLLQKGFHA